MNVVLGIDPGAKYTAAVVRKGDEVLLASTFVRADGVPPVAWADQCVNSVRNDILPLFPEIKQIGIEGIQTPRGFNNGKKSFIQPGPLINMAMVLGALARDLSQTHTVVIVPAKKNGAGNDENYPAQLIGRRPADLLGSNNNAGTRRHEKSAYDIGGQIELLVANGYRLDEIPELY